MSTLYTYSYSKFDDLKAKIAQEGHLLISFPVLEIKKPENIDLLYVDITSLITAMILPNNTTFIAEKIIAGFDFDYRLIIDEDYADLAKKLFRHNIDRIERLELFSADEEQNGASEVGKRILLSDFDDIRVNELKEYIDENLFGHINFKNQFIEHVKKFIVFNKLNEHKILSIFLLGKSGVGKTEVGRLIHNFLAKDTKPVKINFGNYSSKDSLNTLIGSPKGYIGSDTGELSEKIKKSKTGVVIIDEFEKADEKIFNFFLELLEDGKFTDTQNIEYDLNGFIFIFTSNLSSQTFDKSIPAELRSRFNYICEFSALSLDNKKEYALKRYNQIIDNYNEVFNRNLSKVNDPLALGIEFEHYENIRILNEDIKKILLTKI